MIKINLTSVLVDDQDKALDFYTDVLGFVKKTEIPLGEFRWLTVVSPAEPDGTELVLEPDAHPAAGPFKQALVEDGIPFTSFAVDDVHAEYKRLRERGIRYPGAARDGRGHHSSLRRHLRQPHPDREHGLKSRDVHLSVSGCTRRSERAPGKSRAAANRRGRNRLTAVLRGLN